MNNTLKSLSPLHTITKHESLERLSVLRYLRGKTLRKSLLYQQEQKGC